MSTQKAMGAVEPQRVEADRRWTSEDLDRWCREVRAFCGRLRTELNQVVSELNGTGTSPVIAARQTSEPADWREVQRGPSNSTRGIPPDGFGMVNASPTDRLEVLKRSLAERMEKELSGEAMPTPVADSEFDYERTPTS